VRLRTHTPVEKVFIKIQPGVGSQAFHGWIVLMVDRHTLASPRSFRALHSLRYSSLSTFSANGRTTGCSYKCPKCLLWLDEDGWAMATDTPGSMAPSSYPYKTCSLRHPVCRLSARIAGRRLAPILEGKGVYEELS
jgi:hypothetical protein